jgi:hypothetical protein
MQLDVITGVQATRNGFLSNTSDADLPLRVVGFGVVDIERYLPVDADRLDLLHDRRFRTLQHRSSIAALRPPPSDLRPPPSDYVSALPFVSGIQIQKTAASTKAAEQTRSAGPKPRVSASVPTRYGAAALTTRPML